VLSFNRVATNGLQGRIHGIQQHHQAWLAFEETLETGIWLLIDQQNTEGDRNPIRFGAKVLNDQQRKYA
jgi:hypothetical protein